MPIPMRGAPFGYAIDLRLDHDRLVETCHVTLFSEAGCAWTSFTLPFVAGLDPAIVLERALVTQPPQAPLPF